MIQRNWCESFTHLESIRVRPVPLYRSWTRSNRQADPVKCNHHRKYLSPLKKKKGKIGKFILISPAFYVWCDFLPTCQFFDGHPSRPEPAIRRIPRTTNDNQDKLEKKKNTKQTWKVIVNIKVKAPQDIRQDVATKFFLDGASPWATLSVCGVKTPKMEREREGEKEWKSKKIKA